MEGLALQAVVFSLIGVSWGFRLTLPPEDGEKVGVLGRVWRWYALVGWAVVDDIIFACGQAAVLWVAWYYGLVTDEALGDEAAQRLLS